MNTTETTTTDPAPDANNTPAASTIGTPENTGASAPATEPTNLPAYSPEAAAQLDAQYDFSPPPASNDPEPTTDGDNATPTEDAQDYSINFPDNFAGEEAPALAKLLTPIAQDSGIDGSTYGSLFARSYAAIEEARLQKEWENRFRQDAELKRDWGRDYATNMATAKAHISFLKEKAGLSDDDLAVFKSPKGMRALYAMATAQGERPAAGLAATQASEISWAEAVLKDPTHPDRNALFDTTDPRYKEVNARFRRAHGC